MKIFKAYRGSTSIDSIEKTRYKILKGNKRLSWVIMEFVLNLGNMKNKSIKNVIVRKANAKDLNDILRLNLELFKKEKKEYDGSLNLKWTHGKIGKASFKEAIIGKNGFVIIVEAEGKVIGYLCGSIKINPYPFRIASRFAKLNNMFIGKKFRNKGIGEKMVKEFLKWCKEKKADHISVNAFAKNKKAINFYQKLGFKDYSLNLEINK